LGVVVECVDMSWLNKGICVMDLLVSLLIPKSQQLQTPFIDIIYTHPTTTTTIQYTLSLCNSNKQQILTIPTKK
jgi:hypothetical protein